MRDVVVLSAVRSPIGSFGGSLSSIEPADLASSVIKEAIERSNADFDEVTHCTLGNCIPTESRSPYISRVASIKLNVIVFFPSIICQKRGAQPLPLGKSLS